MKKLALAYIVAAGVLWGTSGIFAHYLAPLGFTSLQMTFFRSIIAVICLISYALIFDRNLFCVKLKELLMFGGSGVAFFLTASCYFYAMQITSVSTAVMLMYTAPIFVLLYSVAFLGEKLNLMKIFSIICIFIGCAFVSGIIGGLKFNIIGILMGLLSGIAYSAYNILTKIEMKNKSNPISATLYCFLSAAIISAFVCDLGEIPQMLTISIFPIVILLGICTCILPYFLYTLAMKNVCAGTASALSVIEPMSATVMSILFLGEPLGVTSVVGIVLILIAVFMLSKSENIEEEETNEDEIERRKAESAHTKL